MGVFDSHGRGIYICRQYIDRFIINIKADKHTEMITLNYLQRRSESSKPLLINEV
ncbi:MAG: hypothetical protein ABIA63_10015 [bacterium]